jgi:hypothetical protein
MRMRGAQAKPQAQVCVRPPNAASGAARKPRNDEVEEWPRRFRSGLQQRNPGRLAAGMNLFRKLWARPVTPAANNEAEKPATQIVAKAGTVMLIEIVATGEQIHVLDSEVIQLMIAAGQIKPVVPAAKKQQWEPPLTQSRWAVVEEYRTGRFIITWNCPNPACAQRGSFVGVKPDKVHLLRAWHCGHVGGEVVPAPIAAKYIVINKPATALFYEPPQPQPEIATDNNFQPLPAALARMERERDKTVLPTRDVQEEYKNALSQYESALAKAAEEEARLQAQGR